MLLLLYYYFFFFFFFFFFLYVDYYTTRKFQFFVLDDPGNRGLYSWPFFIKGRRRREGVRRAHPAVAGVRSFRRDRGVHRGRPTHIHQR